ncbi:MAG: methylated-DNA--[protein]-cysteine S-methyltransferase [Bacillota bacterium]
MSSDDYYISYYPSPIGILKIKFTVNSIQKVSFVEGKINNIDCNGLYYKKEIRNTYNLIYDQLNGYFTGKMKEFQLDLSFSGTDFKQKVWSYIRDIPFGEVCTYKQVARKVGNEDAVRAVGNACRDNPILIFIPCHRVVKANGEPGGYAGNNYRKQWLLQHEKKHVQKDKVQSETSFSASRKNNM